MFYGDPFEARCAVCGKKIGGIALSDWEICDECAKNDFAPPKDKEKRDEKDK